MPFLLAQMKTKIGEPYTMSINVLPYVVATQYTGSNSAELDAAISNFTIVSESGGVLVATSYINWTINAGDWVIHSPALISSVSTPAQFAATYVEYFAPSVDTSPRLRGMGKATVPALLLGANTTVAVAISPAQLDDDVTANAYLVGAAANLTINSVTVVDEDTVSVNVSAGLAYVAGAQILVTVS